MTLRPVAFMLVLAAVLAACTPVPAQDASGPLVSPEWVHENLGDPALRVVDIRTAEAFAASHIPSAVNGPYPALVRTADWRVLPVADLVRNFAALGIGEATEVVVAPAGEDSTEFGGASSVYWALDYLGHGRVAILDGGMTAWRDQTLPVQTGAAATPPQAGIEPELQPQIRATTEDVLAALGDGRTLIIDARPPAQYRGEAKSPLVSRAGRIPGAVSLPHTEVFDAAAHRLKPAEAIRGLLPAAIGDAGRPIIVYCNTGHWSSIVWFALHEVLGLKDVRLYDGSMKAWTENPDRPVVVDAP